MNRLANVKSVACVTAMAAGLTTVGWTIAFQVDWRVRRSTSAIASGQAPTFHVCTR